MLSDSSAMEFPTDAERYRVCDLLVEVDTRRVLRGEQEVHLTELSFDVLVTLLRHAPEVVSKQQLMTEVWQGLVVEPDTVKKRITLLRESLSDGDQKDSLIRVVRGCGYAINAPVIRFDASDLRQGRKPPRVLIAFGGSALFALGLTLAAFMLPHHDDNARPADLTVNPATLTVPAGAQEAKFLPYANHEDIDPLAYQAYINGRMLRRTNRLSQAITELERAIDIEPRFAAAYAELGLCIMTRSGQGPIEDRGPDLEAARALAQRALELDPQLPMAYAIAGAVELRAWNWVEAGLIFQKGLSLAPDDEYLLIFQSNLAGIMGDMDAENHAAMLFLERRVTESTAHVGAGDRYYRAGRYREAIDAYRQALVLSPDLPDVHMSIGRARALQGNTDAAVREMDLEPHPDCRLYGLVIAHTAAGNEPVATGLLEKLMARGAERWAYRVGSLHAYRGDSDKAFDSLDSAYALHDADMRMIKTDPLLAGIRDDPRYGELLVRLNLD